METLLASVIQILDKDAKLQLRSNINSYLVSTPDTVLWDQSLAHIDTDLYQKLKVAMHKRSDPFYTLSKVLPYADFCVALLCSVSYSLNHNVVSIIQARTFKSAWRTIPIIAKTADEDVREWVNERLQDRDQTKYTIATDINITYSPLSPYNSSAFTQVEKFKVSEDIISKACASKNIVEVVHDSDIPVSALLRSTTTTPECQLDSLRIIHQYFLDNSK